MDQKIPFTSYDFWAYLSAGFLLLFAIDNTAGTNLLLRDSWTVPQGVIAFSVAYVVGQIVGSLSSWVFERGLVGRVLGYPRSILFGDLQSSKSPAWLRGAFGAYFQPLPVEVQAAVHSKATKAGVNQVGDAMFLLAFSNARLTPAVMARLDNFLNLYGFSRNTALVGFIDAAIFCASYLRNDSSAERLLWSGASLVIALGMLLRYLKFYRLYAQEVFTSFAYANEAPKDSRDE